MEWGRELADGLDLALNESQVCGLSFDADAAEARLLVEVLALPDAGPIDRDPRRVLVFSGVASVEVILRADRDDGLGPVLSLESLDALPPAPYQAGLGANLQYATQPDRKQQQKTELHR